MGGPGPEAGPVAPARSRRNSDRPPPRIARAEVDQPFQIAQPMPHAIARAMHDRKIVLFMIFPMMSRGLSACFTESLVCGGAALVEMSSPHCSIERWIKNIKNT